MRKAWRFFLILCFTSSVSFAQVSSPVDFYQSSGSEYSVGRELGKPLITVNLLNGVTHPGVYHIPAQTTLPQLLSYAGGSTSSSDTSEIRVRRMEHDKSIFVQHDLNSIINENQAFPVMMDKDVIQIKEKNNLDSTLRWVAVCSGIATTLLSIALISQYNRNH